MDDNQRAYFTLETGLDAMTFTLQGQVIYSEEENRPSYIMLPFFVSYSSMLCCLRQTMQSCLSVVTHLSLSMSLGRCCFGLISFQRSLGILKYDEVNERKARHKCTIKQSGHIAMANKGNVFNLF